MNLAARKRNEMTLAGVRIAVMLGILGVEAWLVVEGSRLGAHTGALVAGTLVMVAWSVAVWEALRRQLWADWAPFVILSVDALYFVARQGAPLWILGIDPFRDNQDLASAVGMAALLMVTGAHRGRPRDAAFATGVGMALYLMFAFSVELERFFVLTHLLLLTGIAFVGWSAAASGAREGNPIEQQGGAADGREGPRVVADLDE